MIRPPVFRCLSAACVATKTPRTLTAKTRSKSARVVSSTFAGHARAGVVHQHVEPAKCRDRPFDGVPDCIGGGGVRLDRDRLSASAFNLFDKGRRCVRAFGVGEGDAGAIRGQAPGDRGADAARTAGDEGSLSLQ